MKECLICGCKFVPKNTKHLYCCVECRKKAWAQSATKKNRNKKGYDLEIKEIKCEFCGKTFLPKRIDAKYCSKSCGRKASNVRTGHCTYEKRNIFVTKQCKFCGKEFETNNELKIFCSKNCGQKQRYYLSGKHVQWDEYLQIQNENRIKKELEKKKEKEPIRCECCGSFFIPKSKRNIYCSETCCNKIQRKKHDSKKRFSKEKIVDKNITLKRLFDRDCGTCYICGKQCDWNDYEIINGYKKVGNNYPSIEHVVPRALGGEHSWKNVMLAHCRCNFDKGIQCPPQSAIKISNTKSVILTFETPSKNVYMYDKNLNLINIFNSTGDAERKTGIKRKGIQNCCRGECKTYKGFVWKYEKIG